MFRQSMRGLRVLDFTHVVAGPLCTMTLADLGADVVKIEPPAGEIGRRIGPPWRDGQSVIWQSVNRNKRSLTLDLKTPAGRRAARRMARQADVVVESFRPGVMADLDLGYDTLASANPALVYCSISAFGQAGPASDRPGVDGIMQAVTGLMSTLGEPESGPAKVQVPAADMVTGYLASIAVLAALHEVRDGGRGQHSDVEIGAIVVTGSERAFAAGADIAEMVTLTQQEARERNLLSGWDSLTQIRKPLVAAVAGYALGGGCELAMLCDVVIAADTARFGQPEITLGILPGLGGTQRLTRAVGKAKAMDLCLTGRSLTAEEAERVGLVSRIVPAADLLDEALAVAQRIARMSRPAGRAVKDAINEAFERPLSAGMRYERDAFYAMFDTRDQTEGMTAFLEKRTPEFTDR